MQKRTKRIAVAAAAILVVLGGAATGYALSSGDGDVPLEGEEYRRVTEVALESAGGGQVIEAERDDDGGAAGFEVEVRLADGRQVEVDLDPQYSVTGTAPDDDAGPEDDAGPDDDAGEDADTGQDDD